MADTDLTGMDLRIPGVNSLTNYTKSDAIRFDGKEHAPSLAIGKHRLFTIPAGFALNDIKVQSLANAVSSGSGTVKFGLMFEGEMSPVYITPEPLAKTVFAKGVRKTITVDGVRAYDADKSADLILEVETGAYTDLDLFIEVDTVPVIEFITRG